MEKERNIKLNQETERYYSGMFTYSYLLRRHCFFLDRMWVFSQVGSFFSFMCLRSNKFQPLYVISLCFDWLRIHSAIW